MASQYPIEAYYPAEAHADFAGGEVCADCVSDHDSRTIYADDRNYPDFSGAHVLGAGPSEFGSSADFGNIPAGLGAWSPFNGRNMGDAFSDFRDTFLTPAAKAAAGATANALMADPTIQASATTQIQETADQKIGNFIRTHAGMITLGVFGLIGGSLYLSKHFKK